MSLFELQSFVILACMGNTYSTKSLPKQDTLSSVTSTAIYLLYCPQFKRLSISKEFKKDDASRQRVLDILGSIAKESALESLHFRCYDEVG